MRIDSIIADRWTWLLVGIISQSAVVAMPDTWHAALHIGAAVVACMGWSIYGGLHYRDVAGDQLADFIDREL